MSRHRHSVHVPSTAGRLGAVSTSAMRRSGLLGLLVSVSISLAACEGMLPLSNNEGPGVAVGPCEQALGQMTPAQRQSEGVGFQANCRAAEWVARCADGYVDRGQTRGQLCFGHKGVSHADETR